MSSITSGDSPRSLAGRHEKDEGDVIGISSGGIGSVLIENLISGLTVLFKRVLNDFGF